MGIFSRRRTAAESRLWKKIYEYSLDEYGDIKGYDDEDARKTAAVAVNGWYGSNGRLRTFKGLKQMPDPGNTFNCGNVLGVHWVDRGGAVGQDNFDDSDGVALLWSDDLQACFIVPTLPASVCNGLPTPREDRLARRWARGRGAACSRRGVFPECAMPYVFPGLAVAYESDKFRHGRSETFIHHFGPGVRCYIARNYHGAPHAIMLRGGKLKLTTHGLAG